MGLDVPRGTIQSVPLWDSGTGRMGGIGKDGGIRGIGLIS